VKLPPYYRLILTAKEIGNEFPYYYPVIARVRFKQDNNTLTMGVNCSLVITYNEMFINKLSDKKLTSIILHEILHYLHDHHARYMRNSLKDNFSLETHNMAMDIEINEFIDYLPRDAFRAKKFNLPERKSYEEYLILLEKEMLKKESQGKDQQENNSLDEDQCGNEMPINDLQLNDYNDTDNTQQEVLNNLLEECKEYEKSIGTENKSDDIIRKIQKIKYRWEQVFQNVLSAKITEITAGFKYRTFQKANRRYIYTPDVIFPVYIDRKIKISLVIIMDISGSMGFNVNKMYGVMKSMINILDMEIDITILEVNVDVVNIMYGFNLNRETIKSKSGGGTDMGSGLRYIQENKMNPDLIVIMTDSYTPWPNPPILSDKTIVITDNPDKYDGAYPMYPCFFDKT
jgi:predicted metal-dependent peptidase